MYGLEAINHANGWAMASVGATIVLTGLTVLSLLISQFHHLVGFLEGKGRRTTTETKDVCEDNKAVEKIAPKKLPNKLDEVSQIYISLTSDQLDSSFQLTELYRVSSNIGFPHPYITIRNFRDSGILIHLGEGLFSWKSTSV